jgi:quercetin dioxygenase-like cupin family protein
MAVRTSIHHRWQEIPSETVAPSIHRRFVTGDRMTVARFELKKDGVVPSHSHENEQITCVLRGALRFDIDGRQLVVRQDEVLQIPGGVEHGVTYSKTRS